MVISENVLKSLSWAVFSFFHYYFLVGFKSSSLLTISSSSTNEKRARLLYLEKHHNDEIRQAPRTFFYITSNHPTGSIVTN